MILLVAGRPVRGHYQPDPPGLLLVLVVGYRWPLTILIFAAAAPNRTEQLAA